MRPAGNYTARFFLWGAGLQWLAAAAVGWDFRPPILAADSGTAAVCGAGLGLALILLLVPDPIAAARAAWRLKPALAAARMGFLLLNSAAEEVLWRGLILVAAHRMPVALAVALATAPYAALHGMTQGARGFRVHLAMGGLLAVLAYAQGGLLGAMVAHACYNLAFLGRGFAPAQGSEPEAMPAAVAAWSSALRANPHQGAGRPAVPALEMAGVCKAYGGSRALDGVTFRVMPGELAVLLGPNGAGKTTLLEILEGLKEPDAGEAMLRGVKVRRARRKAGRRCGVILQDNRIPPKLTVAETLGLFRAFADGPPPIGEMLERFRLGALRRRLTETLSGGERQRLALAIAVMERPDVLILDEPTAALDPYARREFWAELRRLHGEGGTVLLATHFIEEAEALCTRVLILNRGRIVGDGTPAGLRSRSACGYRVTVRSEAGADRNFPAADVVAGLEQVAVAVAEHGASLVSATLARPSLQEVFFQLTGERFEP